MVATIPITLCPPSNKLRKTSQAVEKGPDARRRAPRHPEAYSLYVEGCRKLANEAAGPLSAACPDVEPRALVGRSLAHVAVAVRTQHVDGSAVCLRGRALPWHERHAARRLVADAEGEAHRPMVVVELDLAAVLEPARGRVVGMQHARGRSLTLAQGGDPGIRRVSLEAAARLQELPRKTLALLGLDRVSDPVGHGGQPPRIQRLGIELELARRRREALP